jgi:hypothetical protein
MAVRGAVLHEPPTRYGPAGRARPDEAVCLHSAARLDDSIAGCACRADDVLLYGWLLRLPFEACF